MYGQLITPDRKQAILSDVDAFMEGVQEWHDMSEASQEVLYEAFMMDMPYGTATGDTDTPDSWIGQQDKAYILDGLETHIDKMVEKGRKVWGKF